MYASVLHKTQFGTKTFVIQSVSVFVSRLAFVYNFSLPCVHLKPCCTRAGKQQKCVNKMKIVG